MRLLSDGYRDTRRPSPLALTGEKLWIKQEIVGFQGQTLDSGQDITLRQAALRRGRSVAI